MRIRVHRLGFTWITCGEVSMIYIVKVHETHRTRSLGWYLSRAAAERAVDRHAERGADAHITEFTEPPKASELNRSEPVKEVRRA